jgi:hypothetical protein
LGALACYGLAVQIIQSQSELSISDRREAAWMLVEGTLIVLGWILEAFLMLTYSREARYAYRINYIFRPTYIFTFVVWTFAGIYQLTQSSENPTFVLMVIWMSTCMLLNVVVVLIFFKLKFSGQFVPLCAVED